MSKIVVAIDLGTSRSAWAYSIKGRAEDDVIIRVPEGSTTYGGGMKTETAILLGAENDAFKGFGTAAREQFIEQTELEEREKKDSSDTRVAPLAANTMLFRWFKVALCEKRGFQSVHEPMATAEGGQQRPLLQVVASALRHFKEDALKHLSSASGAPQGVEDVTWVVTIPAIYDDFAKSFMRHAAFEAGMIGEVGSSKLQLCLEPEGACLSVNVMEAPHLCEPGTTLMIVDCGGGTVDITTHKVLSTSPLRLKEVLPPTGGPWGSTCVDTAFKEWLKGFIGNGKFEHVQHSSSFYFLMQQWEDGKIRFGGGDGDQVRLNLGDISRILGIDASNIEEIRTAHNDRQTSPALHVTGGKFLVVLPSPLVKSFFDPTIKRIGTLLRRLKHDEALSELKYVFLVGGFSSSPLVQATAHAELDGSGCAVRSALRPEVAIVRGAVLFANDVKVFNTRKARLTYGVKSNVVYDASNPKHAMHYDEHRAGPGYDGRERIRVFSRHITVGHDIPLDGSCEALTYNPIMPTQPIVTFTILASHKKDIEFPTGADCFKLGEVTVPLDMNVPFADRSLEAQFTFGGTELSVTCTRKSSGETVGQTTLSLVQEVEAAF